MKQLLILGAGTAGTMMANSLAKKLPKKSWQISIIDQHATHYYQPGFLFIPFGLYGKKDVEKSKKKFIPSRVNYIQKKIKKILPEENKVLLEEEKEISYDLLVIATGCRIAPDELDGLTQGWHKDIFDFYTIEGAMGLAEKLKGWSGGKMVLHLNEMPIKCPVAPLEFLFLADSWLKKKGLRQKTELTYVTPLSGAFTKPIASKILSGIFEEKGINLVVDYGAEKVDAKKKELVSYDEIKVPYDLLISIPTNMGDDLIRRSGMGDDLNFVPTDKHTLKAKGHRNIFVIGDASDIPTSKAGSVAHFSSEVLVENILSFVSGKSLDAKFDGHANCFIESGNGKGMLIDFNYDQEPVSGSFPLPVVGPFPLLKESRLNHFGKLFFKWIYWYMLLKARPMPFMSAHMSKKGKNLKLLEGEA